MKLNWFFAEVYTLHMAKNTKMYSFLYFDDSIQRLTYGRSMAHFVDILVDFEQRSFF